VGGRAAYPWRQAFVLLAIGVPATVAVLPYQLALQPALLERAPLPLLVLGAVINSTIEVGLAVGLGLLVAREVGLRSPISEAIASGGDVRVAIRAVDVPRATVLGVGSAIVVILLDAAVFGTIAASIASSGAARPSRFVGFLASFEGGITEEILLRLFVMSVIAWTLSRVWRQRPAGIFWAANVAAAVLFGLLHVPATAALVPLTPLVVVRAIVLNGLVGVVAGWLYWRRGLESAMVAHFCADLVVHVALAS
jgi:CAAX prenyl protease-like protein